MIITMIITIIIIIVIMRIIIKSNNKDNEINIIFSISTNLYPFCIHEATRRSAQRTDRIGAVQWTRECSQGSDVAPKIPGNSWEIACDRLKNKWSLLLLPRIHGGCFDMVSIFWRHVFEDLFKTDMRSYQNHYFMSFHVHTSRYFSRRQRSWKSSQEVATSPCMKMTTFRPWIRG